MNDTLLDNIAATQALDEALKEGESVERIVAAVLALLLSADLGARQAAIAQVKYTLVRTFQEQIQPAARYIGQRNARNILKEIDSPPPPMDDMERRLRLIDATHRQFDRVQIIEAIIDDKANTLANRLTAFFLEPGMTAAQKLVTLRAAHREHEQARREYEAEMKKYRKGETDQRPRKPRLDFVSAFIDGVKQGLREQAHRAASDAETQVFVLSGESEFVWISVVEESGKICPDCKLRHGVVGNLAFWDQMGRPGAGKTICAQNCRCQLLPARVVEQNPSLKDMVIVPRVGVLTTDAERKKLERNRAA